MATNSPPFASSTQLVLGSDAFEMGHPHVPPALSVDSVSQRKYRLTADEDSASAVSLRSQGGNSHCVATDGGANSWPHRSYGLPSNGGGGVDGLRLDTTLAGSAMMLDPAGGAGAKMAMTGSGLRLKRRESYQQRNDVAVLREAVTEQLGAASGDGDDGHASLASTVLTEELGRRTHKRGLTRLVPLWVQVCLLMLVPITLVAVYLGITAHAAYRNYQFLRDNEDVITQLMACELEIVLERGRTIGYLATHAGPEKATARVVMIAERRQTDSVCDELVRTTLQSKFAIISQEFHSDVRRALSAVRVLRFAVDADTVSPADYRAATRRHVAALTNGIMLIARESTVPRRLFVLSYLRHAANRAGICRAMLLEMGIVGVMPNEDMRVEFDSECVQSLRRHMRDYMEIARGHASELYTEWLADGAAQTGVELTRDVVEREVGEPFDMASAQLYSTITPTVERLDAIAVSLLEDIVAAREEKRVLVAELAKVLSTLCVSLIGVLFVSRAQRLASARVDYALERTHKMSLAVQAFIPRNFLRLMAVESILNLERGDQTQVAVTILFCDIRNFTGISENMTNEQLFEWLQAHLKRMTHATEKHRGFVSAYIGDAVSAIFLTPMDACRCAVNMQAVTDALCSELVAHNEDHMVRIGVGVHHAIVGVAILGNDKHHSCAIVSAEVNVANQLEALTKEYGARIIVTAQVHDQLQPGVLESRPLGRVRLSASAVREYVLHEIFQADMPEVKAYKSATRDEWEDFLSLRETERFMEADTLLMRLEVAAQELRVKDASIAVKRANPHSPVDVFDM